MPALPTLLLQEIIFYVYAALLIGAATMVIVSRNPVRSALFLVLAFFCSAVLWMMLQAEFLALVLIFVYVGAVMTLFLFVVMMINIDLTELKEGFVRYLPYAVLVMILLVGTMWLVLSSSHNNFSAAVPMLHSSDYNNTRELGILLFTHYLYSFELAGFILLVAMIAAISLAFHGRKPDTHSQRINLQLAARKQDRLRIVKMK